jgi:hypothetical protein
MAQMKFDGVIEAVRYTPAGQVAVVRVYERRGATFSDRILITRDDLIHRLETGKRYVIGQRRPLLASTFYVGSSVRLLEKVKSKYLITKEAPAGDKDDLAGVPLF